MVNKSTSFDFGHNKQDSFFEFENNRQDNLEHWGNSTEQHDQPNNSELVYITCSQVTKLVRNITDTVKKAWPMPTAPPPNSGSNAGSPQRAQRQANTQRGGIPWLNVEKMSATPKEARIMDYQLPDDPANGGRKFNDIVLKLYYNGAMFLWGLKFTSPHYSNLYSWFGSEFDNWKEKRFLLGTEVREFDGRVFAHTEPLPQQTTGKTRK